MIFARCINKNNNDELVNFLHDIGVSDSLLTGELGEGSKWEIAKNYDNNLEYLLYHAQSKNWSPKIIIREFFDEWLKRDSYYTYFDYIFTNVDDNKHVVSIELHREIEP